MPHRALFGRSPFFATLDEKLLLSLFHFVFFFFFLRFVPLLLPVWL